MYQRLNVFFRVLLSGKLSLFWYTFLSCFACCNFLSPSSLPLIFPSFSSLRLCPFSPFPPLFPPVLGISGSISFKAHVRGTVCCFQRPLCPAFLPLNLVSPKHFPIAWPSRPVFSQLPLSCLSLPLIPPTALNTFFLTVNKVVQCDIIEHEWPRTIKHQKLLNCKIQSSQFFFFLKSSCFVVWMETTQKQDDGMRLKNSTARNIQCLMTSNTRPSGASWASGFPAAFFPWLLWPHRFLQGASCHGNAFQSIVPLTGQEGRWPCNKRLFVYFCEMK